MNSFEIILKNNRAEIEILTTRALLAIAGVAAFVYADEGNYYSGIGLGLLLFLLSFFVKTILDKYKMNRLLLLGIGGLLTYITTGSIGFAVVLLVHGIFFEMLNKKIKVAINTDAITVYYVFYKKVHRWIALNNLILKDRILTIDFKDDHLLQAEIAPESFDIDEKSFNGFCAEQLQNNA
ncbi:MAG: hypothetical protein ABI666_12175 [Ferruginibacter sp.]